jgi:phenylalanyl-tRNA synthetase alpha subunit
VRNRGALYFKRNVDNRVTSKSRCTRTLRAREQIKSARDQFEALIAQLKQEHEDRIEDLKAELEAVKLLMGFEQRRLSSATPPTPPQASRSQSRSALPLREK